MQCTPGETDERQADLQQGAVVLARGDLDDHAATSALRATADSSGEVAAAAPARRRMRVGVARRTIEMCTKLEKLAQADPGDAFAWVKELSSSDGDWLSKLKETYRGRPGSDRELHVQQHYPALHKYLAHWRTQREKHEQSRSRRRLGSFWLSAAECFQIMVEHRRAPSQASDGAQEVALAKWLSRWSQEKNLLALRSLPTKQRLARELAQMAKRLRSSSHDQVLEACKELHLWPTHPIYEALVAEAVREAGVRGPELSGRADAAAKSRQFFWLVNADPDH